MKIKVIFHTWILWTLKFHEHESASRSSSAKIPFITETLTAAFGIEEISSLQIHTFSNTQYPTISQNIFSNCQYQDTQIQKNKLDIHFRT